MFRVTTLDLDNVPRRPRTASVRLTPRTSSGVQANLTVSGQLEAEAMATALGKVYTFGPTFRAEESYTPAPRGGVLDDRARDRLCRPRPTDMDTGRGHGQVASSAYLLEHLPRRAGVLQPVL